MGDVGWRLGLMAAEETPALSADEKAEVARFGIHDQGPGLPEVVVRREERAA